MKKCLRKSGIDVIGDVPWGTHICQFYHTKEDLTDILVPYFKAGLENNEFCLWVTSQPLEVEDAIEALRNTVPNFDVYLKKGQIEIISYKDWFLTDGSVDSEKVLNGWVEKLTYASYNGYEGFRLSANTSWLNKENWDSFIKYKEQSDNVIGNYQMLALCTYSPVKHNIAEIVNLSLNHQFILVKNVGKWELFESSKRKIVEETAVKAAKDWEHTFDAVPDLIAIIDTNYKIVRANRAMASKLGMTPEECIGLTCYSVVHETTKPPSFCPHRQMLKDGFEHTAEVCEDCLGGYFIVNVSPLYDSEGKLTGSIHVARGINERRQMEEALRESEEKYRNLIETANEGIGIVDADFKITYVNKKIKEMFGHSSEESIGRSIWDSMSEDSKANLKPNLENNWKGFNGSLEIKHIRKNGSPMWAQVNAKSLYDKDGKFAGTLGMLIDITERKEAEAKLKETLDNLETLVKERTAELEKAYNSLKESENSLAEAQKMAHLGNWDWNLITGEMYWSDEMSRIFGLNHCKFVSSFSEVLSCTHPDDRENVDNAVKRALKGESFAIDHRLVLAGGEERTVHAQGDVVYDEKNTPVRMRGTVQDITGRVKSEEKIRNLANIVESTNDAIGTISLDGKITSWNKGAEQVYAYSAEEILGKPSSILAPKHLREETQKLIERIKQGECIQHYETLRLRKDGKIIDVSRTLSPVFDSNGKVTAISFISRDITERKRSEEKLRESEEKYRNIVDTANEGIVRTDNESVITYVNNQMVNMLGYTIKEVIGRTIWDFISDEYKPIIKQHLEKKKLGTSESGDLKLLHKDGSHVWAHMNSKPLFDQEGKYIGAVSMITDISKRKEAEQALANFEIAREKEIHHRIKNNLQVVYSMIDFQAFKFKGINDIKDLEVIDSLRESKNRVRSMALIHEELYKSSELEKINFSAYVEKLANNLLSIYKLENIDVSLNKDIEEDLFFGMDTAISLGTVVNELVSNSLKYAFHGRDEGEILIKMHREENQDSISDIDEINKSTTFVLTVSDNGIGIPENLDIEKLDSLGLQLVTSLTYKLSGELEIKRNSGTEFTIRFIVTEKNNQASAPVAQQPV
jgi:PAS domain S-box-containing protein